MHLNESPNYISLTDIHNATVRLPYTESDLQLVANYLANNQSKKLDTQLNAMWEIFADDFIKDGVIVISSPSQIERDFVFVKLNAGKGLFGGQKTLYGSYLGSVHEDKFLPSTTFKFLGVALTSINNIYRSIGLL